MTHPMKSRLHLAVAAAVGSLALAAAPAQSAPYQLPAGPTGGSATNTGQIATAFYVAQPEGGWQTLFNVTNTTGNALAVKVRIKEFKNSRDALDYWVLLSPYDVWTGWLSEEADGIYMNTKDNSCTSPLFPVSPLDPAGTTHRYPLQTSAFYGAPPDNADDGGSTTPAEAFDRLKMGHVEFVVAGECYGGSSSRCMLPGSAVGFGQPDGIGYLTKHVNGVPANCVAADKYFLPGYAWNGSSVPGNGDPKAANPTYSYASVTTGAPIKVNVAYLQVGDGTGAATQALHLEDVLTYTNQVTAQAYPFFLEPTLATAPAGIWNLQGLLDLEQRFTWTTTLQEWSVNPAAGVQTSIMMNFPTKGYHVDQYCNEPYASNNRWRYNGAAALPCATEADAAVYNNVVPGKDYSILAGVGAANPLGVRTPTFYPTLQPFPKRWLNGKSDIRIGGYIFDREEYMRNETQWSPFRQSIYIPWEVALLSFDTAGGAFGISSAEIYIDAPATVNAPNGWIDVAFIDATSTTVYGPNIGTSIHGTSFQGLPMHGVMVKTRDLGIPGTSYGQGTENGYRWEFVELN